MNTSKPFLSIVIPALNEASRLPRSLHRIDQFLATQDYAAEVLVVDNGSTDNTAQIVRDHAQAHPYVRLIQLAARGKGLAVRAGMLQARGAYRFICDADLSMPIEELPKFFAPQHADCDLVIGSREGVGARRVGEPEYRHLMGRILNWIVKLTAVRQFEDTQCGFKLIRAEAAEDLFSVQQMNGIGFDVEIIFIALRRGYRIADQPITWYYDADSRMRLIQDSLHILVEIWHIRQNWRKGIYERRNPTQEKNYTTHARTEIH